MCISFSKLLTSNKEIAELDDLNQENCISVFIPTHRAGKDVLQQKDALVLKNQLKEVKNKLAKKGIHADVVDKMTCLPSRRHGLLSFL